MGLILIIYNNPAIQKRAYLAVAWKQAKKSKWALAMRCEIEKFKENTLKQRAGRKHLELLTQAFPYFQKL